MIQFDEHIFQRGWFNHQLDMDSCCFRWDDPFRHNMGRFPPRPLLAFNRSATTVPVDVVIEGYDRPRSWGFGRKR